MRRMTGVTTAPVAVLSRNGSEPMLRFAVEMMHGSLTVQLASATGDEAAIQWTQNGTPLPGQTGQSLCLSALNPDDGDVYYAVLRSALGESRSQSFLVVVVPGNPLLNVSARGHVTSTKPLITGFVIGRIAGPIKPKRYLIRVIGDSLRRFGVTETLRNPAAVLYRGSVKFLELTESGRQAPLVREWSPKVGAFALDDDAADLVAVADLPAGAFSVIVNAKHGEGGDVLVEIYEIPG